MLRHNRYFLLYFLIVFGLNVNRAWKLYCAFFRLLIHLFCNNLNLSSVLQHEFVPLALNIGVCIALAHIACVAMSKLDEVFAIRDSIL